MSSIAGFFSPEFQNEQSLPQLEHTADQILKRMAYRGPDCSYRMTTSDGILMYNGLYTCEESKQIVPTQGKGPLSHLYITYQDGIYNYDKLASQLRSQNISTKDLSRPEILLYLYHLYGERFASLLRGGFAIAITDVKAHKVILFRDPMGIKPLFYHQRKDLFLFASEIKGIFAYPEIDVTMDLLGMHQVFSLGPAHVPGTTPYRDIKEVRPGRTVTFFGGRCTENIYWHLQAKRHEESYEETIDHASYLLKEAVHQQYHSDAANCCLLSGGLDSSIVTALVNRERQDDTPLSTYSFDFAESSKYFSANNFQPSLDRPYVIAMTEHLQSSHVFLECNASGQANLLTNAVLAHDGPCMADISSSLIYFCRQVAQKHRVAFTGECADEVFCGYPWYHKDHMRHADTFPWTMDLAPRQLLLKDEWIDRLQMEQYIDQIYHNTCRQVSYLPEDTQDTKLHRKLFVLTTQYFMQTLLDRMDRAAALCQMEALVPFADLDLVDYLYNIPWEMKAKDGDVKHLLKQIARPYLPDSVWQRKKSPYPKNYHPEYEQILCKDIKQVLRSANQPINDFIDPMKTLQFCDSPKDYGKPWYGQLMAGPQLLAYYLQINYWLREYHVTY